jgi:large subunit ribosomal protein L21
LPTNSRRSWLIYAVIKSGGKQYRVQPGQRLRVDRMQVEAGQQVELGDVLLVAGNGEVHSGDDYTAKAKVVAEVAGHGRAPKLIVFKYKPKVRYRRKKGHRQDYTELFVRDILADGKKVATVDKPAAKAGKKGDSSKRPSRRQKADIAEDVAEVAAGALADAPEQEVEPGKSEPAPQGRRRQAKAVAEGALADAPETEVEQATKRAARPQSQAKPKAPARAKAKPAPRARKKKE